jgi:hypothetical protein
MCLEPQLHRCAQQNFALKVSIFIGSSTTGRLIHGQSMPYKDDGVQMESVGLKVPIPMYNSSMSSQLPQQYPTIAYSPPTPARPSESSTMSCVRKPVGPSCTSHLITELDQCSSGRHAGIEEGSLTAKATPERHCVCSQHVVTPGSLLPVLAAVCRIVSSSAQVG